MVPQIAKKTATTTMWDLTREITRVIQAGLKYPTRPDTFLLQALQGRTDRSVGQKRRAGSTITSFFFCRTSHPSFLVMKRKVGLHSAGLHSRLLSPGGTLDGGRSGVALGPPRCPGFARTWTGPSPRTTRTSSTAPPASLPAATTQGP